MSSAIAFFSSSSRSTRSMKAFSWSFPNLAAGCSSWAAAAAAVAIGNSSFTTSWWEGSGVAPSGQGRRRIIHIMHRRPEGQRHRSMLLACFFERGFLVGRRLFLILRLPFLERHAVHGLAALVLRHCHALGVGGILHPVRQAVAAEAGEVHQVDVLHVGARAQMLEQAPERGGFELRAGLVVHGVFSAFART